MVPTFQHWRFATYIVNIRRVLEENPQKSTRSLSEELGASKVTIIARLRHLENHTVAVDLDLMNWHLNRLNAECIYVVRLSVILWMIDLSGKLSHVIRKCIITATLTPRNSGSVHVNLPKSSLKKSFRPQSNFVCLVEFWRCYSLRVCSKWVCSYFRSLFSTTGMSSCRA